MLFKSGIKRPENAGHGRVDGLQKLFRSGKPPGFVALEQKNVRAQKRDRLKQVEAVSENFYGYIEKYEPKFAYYLYSSETVSFFLPLALLLFSTLRPFTLDILSRNPCLFFLFLTDG